MHNCRTHDSNFLTIVVEFTQYFEWYAVFSLFVILLSCIVRDSRPDADIPTGEEGSTKKKNSWITKGDLSSKLWQIVCSVW
jgi:hypothetical protein